MRLDNPLTLEELRLMDGEPVLVDYIRFSSPIYALVDVDRETGEIWLTNSLGEQSVFSVDEDLYDEGILVYRCQPHGGNGLNTPSMNRSPYTEE